LLQDEPAGDLMKTVIAFGLIFALLLAGCAGQGGTTQAGKGRAVFTMTDAAADMGAVSSVKVTVDKVSVHSAAKGWVDVSTSPVTLDLMELKRLSAESKQALLADAQLDSGNYEQVRLEISKVVVTDAQGDHEAKLPSGELKIIGNLSVQSNSTSVAAFDFIADESLHVTGKGEYILAPVVKLETRDDAEAQVQSDGHVVVTGGNVRTSINVGMDEKGNVGVGLRIPANANLSISGGVISIGPGAVSGKGRIIVGITDAAANMSSVTKVKVTVQNVSVQSSTKGWVTLSTSPKTYDLLELKGKAYTSLLADAEIEPGDYNQIRLDISKVVVTDSSGDHEAKLPSGELKVIGDLKVESDSDSTAIFDFIADQSLHVTGNGAYVFAPVIKVETRDDADAEVDASARVRVSGGKVRTNMTVGMDEMGRVGVGLKIPGNAAVTITANGTIVVTPKGPPGANGTTVDVGGAVWIG
jgi:hypothetical protein